MVHSKIRSVIIRVTLTNLEIIIWLSLWSRLSQVITSTFRITFLTARVLVTLLAIEATRFTNLVKRIIYVSLMGCRTVRNTWGISHVKQNHEGSVSIKVKSWMTLKTDWIGLKWIKSAVWAACNESIAFYSTILNLIIYLCKYLVQKHKYQYQNLLMLRKLIHEFNELIW